MGGIPTLTYLIDAQRSAIGRIISRPIGLFLQLLGRNAFEDDSGIWTFENITFKGEDVSRYACDPMNRTGLKIAMIKKYIKSIPRFISRCPIIRHLPPIRNPDAILLQQLKTLYLDRIQKSEKFINGFQGVTFGDKFDASDYSAFINSAFDLLTVTAEADYWWRNRILDFLILNYQVFIQWELERYSEEGNTEAVTFLERHLKEGPLVRLVDTRVKSDLALLANYCNAKMGEAKIGRKVKELRRGKDPGQAIIVFEDGAEVSA